MRTERGREILNRLEDLHRNFERRFPELYSEKGTEELYKLVSGLYEIVNESMELVNDLYREMAAAGPELESTLRELQKGEHQMKFRLEELLGILAKPQDYSTKARLKVALDRLVQFHRVYDYTVSRALASLGREIEGLEFMERMGVESENQKKAPASIIERLRKIDETEEKLERLTSFVGRLYLHPSDVYRVENALMEWHRMGLLWVEARYVGKLSGVANPEEILEGLALIGVVEKKERGGESVYRHRSFSSG